ncbi:MAG: carboxymuconolactone decarboxylase family protein [Acidimicrobiia bacterium]|nr:carboxymuconolactone decarboxylase family protein [Acidimicrobiia bacterium]
MQTLDSVAPDTRSVLEHVARAALAMNGQLLNLHAQMATAPAVLGAYAGIRQAFEEHGTMDARTRAAIMLTTSAADGCQYAVAINTVLARRAGWTEAHIGLLRAGKSQGDLRLDALLEVVREAATRRGSVSDSTWQAALDAAWTREQLAEAFVYLGLTTFVDYFLEYAKTDIDVPAGFGT